jgi:large conductance mechanosensitive channel
VKIIQNFKQFLLRGNLVDLAVAVVIGAAFGALVKSTVEDLFTPLLGIIGKKDFSGFAFTIRGSTFRYGEWVNEVVSFLIVAAVVYFLILVPVNALIARNRSDPNPVDPTTRKCPECLSEIPMAARRCACCTSQVAPA